MLRKMVILRTLHWFFVQPKIVLLFTFIHLADVFIQSDLQQLLYMSEVACLWSN